MVAWHSIEISLKGKEFQQSLEESNASQRLQIDETKEASSQVPCAYSHYSLSTII